MVKLGSVQPLSNFLPVIRTKEKALNGKASVVEYEREPGKWYLRFLVEGTKKYRSRLIPSARTLEEALAASLDVYLSLQETPITEAPRRAGGKKTTIASAVGAYLDKLRSDVDAGVLAQSTYNKRRIVLSIHLIAYCDYVGVTYCHEIDEETFSSYLSFRRGKGKYTRKKELDEIKTFYKNWLLKHRLLTPDTAMSKTLFPRVQMKQADFDANPAISPEDWKIINYYIRTTYLQEAAAHTNHRVHHWRYLFWTFTIIMKNTGCRPNELLSLRWKDVQIENIGRWSESKQIEEDRLVAYLLVTDSKTGAKREVPANVGDALIRWMKYRISYVKAHQPHLYEQFGANSPEQLVFGNPWNDYRSYALGTYQHTWRKVVGSCQQKLKGNRFSDRPYTIYSMRSTFIENKLIEGMDIFLLARICGHSVKVLMTHYERMDIRKRADEITHIEYGKKKDKLKIVDVLTE